MIDVDHFKSVNDNHGHDVGDRVLVAIAETILRCVGRTDIVARFGGEEFAVLLPGVPAEKARTIGDKIRTSIEGSEIVTAVHKISVTVSVGVAAGKASQTMLDGALKHADDALYSAKRNGRNCVEHRIAA